MVTKTLAVATATALIMTFAAHAGEEPYGEGFDGWKFTQQDNNGSANCRAYQGNNLMSVSTDGKRYVSVAGNLPKGNYPESTLEIGSDAEMVDAASGGVRLLFHVDEYLIEKIAQNRGYGWRVAVGDQIKTGKVKFNNSAMSALERVMECVSANGG